jgi:hypothetical protein
VLEDLLSVGSGLDIGTRPVTNDDVGPLVHFHSRNPVLAVARGGELMRFDDPRASELQRGDYVVMLISHADGASGK